MKRFHGSRIACAFDGIFLCFKSRQFYCKGQEVHVFHSRKYMGVDCILLTQHPMPIHSNKVQLVGLHLRIRRMGNMALAVVYEWDSY